jgi:hypothetical protein
MTTSTQGPGGTKTLGHKLFRFFALILTKKGVATITFPIHGIGHAIHVASRRELPPTLETEKLCPRSLSGHTYRHRAAAFQQEIERAQQQQ